MAPQARPLSNARSKQSTGLREILMRRIIGHRLEAQSNRVCKRSSENPTSPHKARRSSRIPTSPPGVRRNWVITGPRTRLLDLQPEDIEPERPEIWKSKSGNPAKPEPVLYLRANCGQGTRLLDLESEQIESAYAILDKLSADRHYSSNIPQIRPLDDDDDGYRFEFVYPRYTFWGFAGGDSLLRLTKYDLRRLRLELIKAVNRLYDSRIAFVLDLATFSVVKRASRRGGRGVFMPFLDSFDFDKQIDDWTVPWDDLKKEQLANVKAHMDVLELLADLSKCSMLPKPTPIRTGLQPDVVVKVLMHTRPRVDRHNWAIRSLNSYSPKLCETVFGYGDYLGKTLPSRKGLESLSSPKQNCLRDHCLTVKHVLELLDRHMQNKQVEDSDLAERARLLVILTVLLIHLHAKAVRVVSSRGILEATSEATADEYTSEEDFQAVSNIRSFATEAISHLESAGCELDEEITWYLFTHPLYMRK